MAKINLCENCGQPYPPDWGDLSRVDNLAERIAPGERVPSGQCGECGALVHLKEVCELGTQRNVLRDYAGQNYDEKSDNSYVPAEIVVSGSGAWVNIRVRVSIEDLDIVEEDDES